MSTLTVAAPPGGMGEIKNIGYCSPKLVNVSSCTGCTWTTATSTQASTYTPLHWSL